MVFIVDRDSIWNEIFTLKDEFHKQLEKENSTHNLKILSEWYCFTNWISSVYRDSFETRTDRKQFESMMAQCSTNQERVDCLMNCIPVQVKFAQSARRLWDDSEVNAKRYTFRFRKWVNYASAGLFKEESLEDENRTGHLLDYFGNNTDNVPYYGTCRVTPDPLDELPRLVDPENPGANEEIHLKHCPIFDDYVENDSLRGVSESIKLGFHPIKRRQLIAAKDIPIGSVIAQERALCAWLAPSMYTHYCYRCLCILSYDRLTCRSCRTVNYCSTECARSAQKEFHAIECPYMGMLKHMSIVHFAIRMLCLLGPNKVAEASLGEFNSTSNHYSTHDGDTNLSFLNLESGTKGVPQTDLLNFSCTAMFTAHLLRELAIFDEKVMDKPFIASLISMNILVSRNLFTLYDHTFRLLRTPDSPSTLVEGPGKEVGYGLFYKTSLFNHSCNPNSHVVFFGDSILVMNTKPIAANEEVTISYGATYPDIKLEDRQVKMRNNFYFRCLCNQCEIDLAARLRAKNCSPCFQKKFTKLMAGEYHIDDESGNIIIETDSDGAEEECSECASFIKENGQLEQTRSNGLAYYSKGRKLLNAADYATAVRYLSKAIKILSSVSDLYYIYNARDDLNTCYRALEQYDKAYICSMNNLKLRRSLYGADYSYLNAILRIVELVKLIKDQGNENFDHARFRKKVRSFYRLRDELADRQVRIVDYSSANFLELLTHPTEYYTLIAKLFQAA